MKVPVRPTPALHNKVKEKVVKEPKGRSFEDLKANYSPAVHQEGDISDPGIPDVVQHADQGGGVLWDTIVWPASEEVVIQSTRL